LAKLVNDNQRDWDTHLSAIAVACRNSIQETTGFSPFFLMFGREARIPADLVYGTPPAADLDPDVPLSDLVQAQKEHLQQAYESTRQHLGLVAQRRKRQYDMCTGTQEFPDGPPVWVLVPRRRTGRYPRRQSLYQGPFTILRRLNVVNYSVQRNPRSRPWTVHVDKLKPYYKAATDFTEPPPTDTPQSPVKCRPRRNIRRPSRYR